MGNSEDGKPDKPSSPATDQNGVHVYPNWPMMQAYYGPQFAVPPYMWVPPQSMIPPYGFPYTAFYAHGGIYGHPGVSMAGTAFSTDAPVKSSANTDGGFMRKLKEFDGLAISIGNRNTESGEHGTESTDYRLSESEETDDSDNGSNGVTTEAGQRGMKRSRPGSPNSEDFKAQKKRSSIPSAEFCREVGRGSESMTETSLPANTSATTAENTDAVFELKGVKPIATNVPEPSIPNEAWLQNKRELKWERRKQSNRESARRSRMRKQAEAEQLATKIQTLTTENTTLKSKINEFMEISEKLKLENAKLMEKLKDAHGNEVKFHKVDNLLARVNDNDARNQNDEDVESYENRNPVTKLLQLLDVLLAPEQIDAVAAS